MGSVTSAVLKTHRAKLHLITLQLQSLSSDPYSALECVPLKYMFEDLESEISFENRVSVVIIKTRWLTEARTSVADD